MITEVTIPDSILAQLGEETVYWTPGIMRNSETCPNGDKFSSVGVFATELDAYIAREEAARFPDKFTFISNQPKQVSREDANEFAREMGCTRINVWGDLKSGDPKLVDWWRVAP